MESFAADLRHAWRVLWKSPSFTLIAVAALAFGVGANTAIFSVVNAVLLRPLPYPESDQLVFLERQYRQGTGNSASIPKFTVWKQYNRTIENMSAYDFAGPGLNLGSGDRPEQVKAVHVSLDYFRLFGATPMLGRTFLPEEDRPGGPRVAVLSNGLWKRRFGADPALAGKAVLLGGEPYTVVGILPHDFQPDPPAEIWLPLQADPASTNQGHYLRVAARLRRGATLEAANAELKLAGEQFRRLHPNWMDQGESVVVLPMQQLVVGNVRPALLILAGAVSFVLLIACANVANLLLARAAGRQKEMAVRAAIGAGRGRLVRQLLTESILLAALGGLLGLLLGSWGVRVLLAFSPGDIPRIGDLAAAPAFALLDWRVLAFTGGIALLTGVLFGLMPALQLSRTDLSSTLKDAGGRSGSALRQSRTRGLLVVTETALALVLLIGATLMIRTFVGLRNVKPGFDPHNILTMQMSMAASRYSTTAQVEAFERQAVQRIESLPGVVAASPAVCLPVQNFGIDLPFTIEGRPLAGNNRYHGDEYWRYVGPRYFDVFRIPLLRGRLFRENDNSKAAPVVIINEALARKYWPGEDPLGKRIQIGKGLGPQFEEPHRQIVGVVGDVREGGLKGQPDPVMYIPAAQVTDGLTRFAAQVIPLAWAVRTSSDPLSLSSAIQREFLAVDGQLPVANIGTMEQLIRTSTARENFNMLLLTIFAAIALLLAAIGIYGLMSYAVEQRAHEIGVRMALCAGRGDVLRMFVLQGARLALIGVGIGLAAAYGLTRLLARLLFGVRATDPWTFAGVAGVLAVVALGATYLPARRATQVDPVIALRYE
ncbi:MAG: ABC transporter permease [Acidobacteria bacterium]|nr:ABC transporter permease [Acidobacteriota bacterium]